MQQSAALLIFSFAWKKNTKVEVTCSDKHASLLYCSLFTDVTSFIVEAPGPVL